MWEIIQLSHHDKLSDRLVTQLQHNFNTTHTLFQHLFQHSFHTSFNNLWNNSSTHFHHILSQFFHNKLFKTWSQNFHSQFMMQYFITILSQQFIHNLWCNTLSQYFHNNSFTIYDAILYHNNSFTTFIKLFSKTFEHSFHNKLSSIVEILMIDASSLFNISSQHLQQTSHHSIFNKHLITASSTNISTNYNTVLHQNM